MQLLIAHKHEAARGALTRAIAGDREAGLEVIESADGEEALELLLRDDAPRLAIVDWDLPGIDGLELCRLVRDFHVGSPPYVVVMAGDRHPDVTAALEAGANDCIRTPAPAAEIRERVTAGLSIVSVAWERGDCRVSLEAVRTSEDGERGGFRTPDAASTAAPREKAELQAVLSQN